MKLIRDMYGNDLINTYSFQDNINNYTWSKGVYQNPSIQYINSISIKDVMYH